MSSHYLIDWLLTLIRVSGFVALWTPMTGAVPPHAVRVGLALALTVFWAPSLDVTVLLTGLQEVRQISVVALIPAVCFELTVGAGIAWLLGLVLLPAQIAGSIFAQELGQSGFHSTSLSGESTSGPLAQLFESVGMICYFALDLHLLSLFILGASFQAFPPGSGPWCPDPAEVIARSTFALEAGFTAAGPMLVLSLLTLTAVLFANRVAPQFHFFTLVLPLRSLMGLLIAGLMAPVTLYWLLQAMLVLAR